MSDDRRRRDGPSAHSNGNYRPSYPQSRPAYGSSYSRPPLNGYNHSRSPNKGHSRRRSRSPPLNGTDFSRSRFDYERSSALNYDDAPRSGYNRPPREYANRSNYGRDRSPPLARSLSSKEPSPPPSRTSRDYRDARLGAPYQDRSAPSERVLYEQGFPVDLSYDDDPLPSARSSYNGFSEHRKEVSTSVHSTPRPLSTYTRSRTPSVSSKLNSPTQSTLKSPITALHSPIAPLTSGLVAQDPPVAASDEVEEGEDIDMARAPPTEPNGLQIELISKEEPKVIEMHLDVKVEPAPPIEILLEEPQSPSLPRTASVQELLPESEIVKEPKEDAQELWKEPSPLPDSFDDLLLKLSSRSKPDATLYNILSESKVRSISPASADRQPIGDITNVCFLPAKETLQTHAQLFPFLTKQFTARQKAARDRSKKLKHEYKAWNKEWKRHVKRMEKLRLKHAKRLTVPLHYGHVLQSHPSLGAAFHHGPLSAGQSSMHAPQTPGGDGISATGYFDDIQSPYGATSIFGGTIVTTPGGPLSGRPSRRSAPSAAGGFGADAVRSEAEFLEILATLENADALDPASRAARSAAVVPDMLPQDDMERLVLEFDNENNLVPDPVEYFGIGPAAAARSDPCTSEWTDEEVDTYCQRFGMFPKQFGKIAIGLPNKDLQQCVLFYYRLKDSIDFRALSNRRAGSGRGRKPKMATSNKGSSLIAAMKPAVEEEEEEEPLQSSATARKPSMAYSYEKVMGNLLEEGVGYSATKRLLYGSNKRAEAELQRQKRAQARLQTQEALQEVLPSDSAMAAAEVLAALQGPGGDLSNPEMEQEVDEAARLRASQLLDKGASTLLPVPKRKPTTSSYWSVTEKTEFARLLGMHGKDFAIIANYLGSKTVIQCRNYFANNRGKLGLEDIANRAETNLTDEQKEHRGETEIAVDSASEFDASTPRNEILPPLNTLLHEPTRGYFPTSANSFVHGDVIPDSPGRPPVGRATSGMKINDLLNADEDESTPMGSIDQDWFEPDAKEPERNDDLTDEEPDLPQRRVDMPARYFPQPAYYTPRYEYEEHMAMQRYPLPPYDPYRRQAAWPPSSHLPPMPPRGYSDRYYPREPLPPFDPYGVPPPRSRHYDPRGR